MTARLRPELAELPAYVPGKTVPGAIKLASNETVSGPLPSVRAAIERATDVVNRYPDNGSAELKLALAKHLNSGRVGSPGGWAPEHIAVGCGSVSLCQQLIQISASAGDEVLFGWRSFQIYPLQVRLAGATAVQVPLSDHTFDLPAMLAAVTDRTRLIFVCNPNNPTSTVVDPDALTRFIEAVPSHILIAIDEAYVEYIRDGLLPDSLGLVRSHSNVVVLRTFSKAYGLAGLRVGYAAGHPELITALDKAYVPFTATSISQAAAIASLEAADELLAHRRGGRRTHTGERHAAWRRVHRPAVAGEFRLAAAGEAHTELRGAGRRRSHRGPPGRHRRCPGDHRCTGGKQCTAAVRAGLDLIEGVRDERHAGAQEVHRVQGTHRRH
jgi:histidinol-phosphate aminotransferase